MASNEDREKHFNRRKRNIYAKVLKTENKFKPKVIDSRKEEYKRIKLNPKDINIEEH